MNSPSESPLPDESGHGDTIKKKQENDDVCLSSCESSCSLDLDDPLLSSDAAESLDYTQASSCPNKGESLGGRESRVINQMRLLLFTALLIAASGVSVVVYIISRNGVIHEYESRYNRVAEKLSSAFQSIAKDHAVAFGALRVAYTAEAKQNNNSWPFVALSSFQQRATTARRLCKGLHLSFYPWVSPENHFEYERYVARVGRSWIEESLLYETRIGIYSFPYDPNSPFLNESVTSIPIMEYEMKEGIPTPRPSASMGPFAPNWQSSPVLLNFVNIDMLSFKLYFKELPNVFENGSALIGDFVRDVPGSPSSHNMFSMFLSHAAQEEVYYHGDPLSNFYYPVYSSFEETDHKPVAVLVSLFHWGSYFENLFQDGEGPITVVLENTCSGPFTYSVKGQEVVFLGSGDFHDHEFDSLVRYSSFEGISILQDGTDFGMAYQSNCNPFIKIYPTKQYNNDNSSYVPVIMTCAVLIVFLFCTTVFLLFNRLVERRQKIMYDTAAHSSAIVSSIFPKAVAERLMDEQIVSSGSSVASGTLQSTNKKLKSFLSGETGDGKTPSSMQTIADLFPFATVMFADIVNFTAWCSSREPVQVFLLLQGVYLSFDKIAKRRKVFKVETIGDSYVAVTGVPDPQPKHALIMARFATECLRALPSVLWELGRTLGPGTSDLQMRFGLHSGPVTAGVLLGERARFQLFGDTVNTAARMESTGMPSRIHISSTTADILLKEGKGRWIKPRDDVVNLKGKGIFKTYWLDADNTRKRSPSVHSGNSHDGCNISVCELDGLNPNPLTTTSKLAYEKNLELVNWICELLLSHIKKIVAKNAVIKKKNKKYPLCEQATMNSSSSFGHVGIPLDEVVEKLALPDYQASDKIEYDIDVELETTVCDQLHQYILEISSMYHDNPFHNFHHACHVTMSVNKLLQRIVTPDLDIDDGGDVASHLYDYTHGINSDPTTLLAILLSAVIHDADHRGVSNVQLMKEQPHMAATYRGKSIAEQNSLDIAWNLLLCERFNELRNCMLPTDADVKRFRQVLVNVVLATDIFDKELNDLRKSRWAKAFSDSAQTSDSEYRRLRGTIVIEHVIQASDVSHTMQHWHVYRQWNERLFRELYVAYKHGRMGSNPCSFWYEGELGFFDNYIIPLAKKLKECQVFGVYSDEYLNYAERNRAEWEARGRDILAEMIANNCDDEGNTVTFREQQCD